MADKDCWRHSSVSERLRVKCIWSYCFEKYILAWLGDYWICKPLANIEIRIFESLCGLWSEMGSTFLEPI